MEVRRSSRLENHLTRLPPEITVYIFSFLSHKDLLSVSRTSRNIKNISLHESLWTKINLTMMAVKINTKSCQELMKRCAKMTHLTVTPFPPFPPFPPLFPEENDLNLMDEIERSLKLVLNAAPVTLTHLAIPLFDYEKALTIFPAIQRLTELTELKLKMRGTFWGLETETICWRSSFESLFSKLRKLKKVIVPFCKRISDEVVTALVLNNPDLEHLDISDCKSITNEALKVIGASCPRLSYIDISCWSVKNEITDSGLDALASGCPLLSTIIMGACKNISDSSIRNLVSVCQYIKIINLSWTNVSSATILQLMKNSDHLKSFWVSFRNLTPQINTFNQMNEIATEKNKTFRWGSLHYEPKEPGIQHNFEISLHDVTK